MARAPDRAHVRKENRPRSVGSGGGSLRLGVVALGDDVQIGAVEGRLPAVGDDRGQDSAHHQGNLLVTGRPTVLTPPRTNPRKFTLPT